MIRWAVALALIAAPALAGSEPEPGGYRMEHFNAPVPETLSGARTIGPEAAYQMWRDGTAAFVDVWPRAPRPEGLPAGTIWREPVRRSIPGAIWLPNTGYGALAGITEDYFRRGLAKASAGDRARPLVFFCLADCWMSWNAAKRALEFGYSEVIWLPEGTDGWAFYDFPLEPVTAEPEP